MTRSHAALLLLVGSGLLCSTSCVEPPAAQPPLCEEDEAQRICLDAPEGFYTTCCNTLNTLVSSPPEPAQIDYYAACVNTITSAPSRLDRCMRIPSEIVTTWSMDRAVTGCQALYESVESATEREKDYVLPCIVSLTTTRFAASRAQDPFALTVFCESIKGARNASYSKNCVEVLSNYSWFPADPGPETGLSESQWRAIGNQIPTLCANIGSCQADNETVTMCLSTFVKFTPEGNGLPAAEVSNMFTSARDSFNRSCVLCDRDNAMTCRIVEDDACSVDSIAVANANGATPCQ